MCTPIQSGGGFKAIGEMIQEGRRRRAEYNTNQFMSPRGDNGIEVQNQQPPPGKYWGNNSNPLANAMVGMAIAKGNPGAFANGPINVNTSSNKTGRVIS